LAQNTRKTTFLGENGENGGEEQKDESHSVIVSD